MDVTCDIEKKFELTEKHFKYFVSRCKYWLSKLHLDNWTVTFAFGGEGVSEDELAAVTYNDRMQHAHIALSKYWPDVRPQIKEIDNTALHEVLHMFFAPLNKTWEQRKSEGKKIRLLEIEHLMIKDITFALMDWPRQEVTDGAVHVE